MSIVYAVTSKDAAKMLPVFLWLLFGLPMWGPPVAVSLMAGYVFYERFHWHPLFAVIGAGSVLSASISWLFWSMKGILASGLKWLDRLGIVYFALYYAVVAWWIVFHIFGHDLIWSAFAGIVAFAAGFLFSMYLSDHYETKRQDRKNLEAKEHAEEIERILKVERLLAKLPSPA